MSLEQKIVERLNELIAEGVDLSRGNENGQVQTDEQFYACNGWLVSAQNIAQQICPLLDDAYRMRISAIASAEHGWTVNTAVGEVRAMLKNLLRDANAGLLASVADQARAETFDDFLDHAQTYHADKRKAEAGVIAGVVFEDSVRRICRKLSITEKGEKLDGLISALAGTGELSAVKAKRARAAADVRTKATHAQWDEFELEDVAATIDFTRELIAAKLE